MNRIARQWAACAWIAVLAVLFNALAPVVSHAMTRPDVAQADICTALGHSTPDPNKLAKALNHCGYCATHAASFAMPPSAGLALALLVTHETHPPLYFQSSSPLPVWTAAQSRAPPVSA